MDQETFFEHRPELMPLSTLLTRAGSALARHHRLAAADHGLTPTALGVLGVLAHRGGVSHRELAGHLGLTPATLTPVVDALEAAREIRRDRDPGDRRIVRLSITEGGRERLAAAFAHIGADLRERLPQPSPEHEAVIRHYLLTVLAGVVGDDVPW